MKKKGYKWESTGAEGYTIEDADKAEVGTEIILHIKPNTEDESYDDYLNEYRLRSIVKKYSDFVRYPIKMDMKTSKLKEDNWRIWRGSRRRDSKQHGATMEKKIKWAY